MLPFLVGVALDYDIFYVEAVLEHCRSGSTPKEASLSALNQTANTITAAGIIMIIAFVPLLLSSTLVMRQIGFMAVVGLAISSGWSTKVVAPLWLQMLDSCSFWPRSFQQDQNPVDVVFLAHPAYLVDFFVLFSSPTDTRWKPSWWMYAFLPLLWLASFFTAHIFRRMGLLSHLVLDDLKYDGLRVQTWAVLHFGRHFRNRCELHDARLNVESAVRHAEKQGEGGRGHCRCLWQHLHKSEGFCRAHILRHDSCSECMGRMAFIHFVRQSCFGCTCLTSHVCFCSCAQHVWVRP